MHYFNYNIYISSLIPIFVRVHAKQREMFIGICEGTFLKTQFQIIHFNYTPSQYAYLSGLLEIFKSKLGSHLLNSSLLITISIRFTYAIQENNKLIDSLMIHQQQQQPYSYLNTEEKSTGSDSSFDLKSFDQETDDLFSIVKYLPFGTNQDCIEYVYFFFFKLLGHFCNKSLIFTEKCQILSKKRDQCTIYS